MRQRVYVTTLQQPKRKITAWFWPGGKQSLEWRRFEQVCSRNKERLPDLQYLAALEPQQSPGTAEAS